VSRSSYQVRAYSVKHSYDISEFLGSYRLILQRAIDEIWANIRWIEKFNRKGRRRLIPIIPKGNGFKHHYLRSLLMDGWEYSKHYVDSAIKQAYSVIKSWRRSYLKGERSREKPTVKKRSVRIKETLYNFRDGKIKVSVKPYEKYLEFDVSRAWFWSRVPKDAEMCELILNEKHLTITFRFSKMGESYEGWIAWDCNERSLDGFNPRLGWIRVTFHSYSTYIEHMSLRGRGSRAKLRRNHR